MNPELPWEPEYHEGGVVHLVREEKRSFWLVDCLIMMGRRDDAQQLFNPLLNVRNDLGLLAEEYDPISGRQLGNFPQAFSHIGLVNSAVSSRFPVNLRSDSHHCV